MAPRIFPNAAAVRFHTVGELADNVYGISKRTVVAHVRRGTMPAPDAVCGLGDLWNAAAVDNFRVTPNAHHAAIVPSADLARSELQQHGLYICPVGRGWIGWASPSIIGLYQTESGGHTDYHTVVGIVRFPQGAVAASLVTPTLTAAQQQSATAAAVARRAHDDCELAVFVLDSRSPFASGKIRVPSSGPTGLQTGRIVRVDRAGGQISIGGGNSWLNLSAPAPLPEFIPPTLDDAF